MFLEFLDFLAYVGEICVRWSDHFITVFIVLCYANLLNKSQQASLYMCVVESESFA